MTPAQAIPRALSDYVDPSGASLLAVLIERAKAEPFNIVATAIFALAILHTFVASRLLAHSRVVQASRDAAAAARGEPARPSVWAEVLHFFGEVEVVFGLWAAVLLVAMAAYAGWTSVKHYFNDTVNYTEALFVVVIMALAATRPIIGFAEAVLGQVARVGKRSVAAWWLAILTIGPLLGSLVTEPAAMTICALLLSRQFYRLQPSMRFRYATLGLLFVNISIGGTLTTFAAPPVLVVARPWEWTTAFMLTHFGYRAAIAILLSTVLYGLVFRRELRSLAAGATTVDDAPADAGARLLPVPAWVTLVHMAFMGFAVFASHEPALVVGAFLFFLGFVKATAPFQDAVDLKPPLLVGFFLAGLVIHGGLQGWWIEPVLARLPELPLFLTGTVLTAFNDNALITYLATLVPSFSEPMKIAVVSGAVIGGGLTVIANAPNPAGQSLLGRFFGGSVGPLGLLLAALPPTIVAAIVFRML